MFDCGLPHADEDVSITEDEEQYVFLGNVVKICIFFIGEKQIWLPKALEHFRINSQ